MDDEPVKVDQNTVNVAPQALEDAIAKLKEELTAELIQRLQTPTVESTRYKLTIYLMIMTSVITLGVMVMSALKYDVPEIATGVILMGIFEALLSALKSYFDARKETDVARLTIKK